MLLPLTYHGYVSEMKCIIGLHVEDSDTMLDYFLP